MDIRSGAEMIRAAGDDDSLDPRIIHSVLDRGAQLLEQLKRQHVQRRRIETQDGQAISDYCFKHVRLTGP
jgi:hypothetical protein